MATLSEALAAYRICAQAEGKSPKTVQWITSSVAYFSDFLGPGRQDIENLTGNDLRNFIITLQQRPKFLHHPFNKPKQDKISPQSIETYARAIRTFFSYLFREEMIRANPMQKVKMPKVPKLAVPTFSQKEIEILISVSYVYFLNCNIFFFTRTTMKLSMSTSKRPFIYFKNTSYITRPKSIKVQLSKLKYPTISFFLARRTFSLGLWHQLNTIFTKKRYIFLLFCY